MAECRFRLGQVVVRKRQPQPVPASVASSTSGVGAGSASNATSAGAASTASTSAVPSTKGKGKIEMRDPKALEELVQQVMRDLPTKIEYPRVGEMREAEEALKKLDKRFDGGGSKG